MAVLLRKGYIKSSLPTQDCDIVWNIIWIFTAVSVSVSVNDSLGASVFFLFDLFFFAGEDRHYERILQCIQRWKKPNKYHNCAQ